MSHSDSTIHNNDSPLAGMDPTMSKPYSTLITLHFTVCTLAMIWPGALIANRIEPTVFGLPFLFFWYILWMLVLFVGMWLAYLKRHGGGRDV